MSTARKWLPRALPVLVAALALGATSLAVGDASSHREAPLIADDPVADATDTYAFVSPDKPDTVTLVGNWVPLEEPAGGPNFAHFGDDVRYDFDVDNNGDNVPDLVYQFTFKTTVGTGDTFLYNTGPIDSIDSKNLNVKQTYTVTLVKDGKSTCGRDRRPGRAGEHRSSVDPELRRARGRGGASHSATAVRCSPVRATTRSSSTSAPCSTFSACGPLNDAHADPGAGRAGRRRSAGLQRALDRAPGADRAARHQR